MLRRFFDCDRPDSSDTSNWLRIRLRSFGSCQKRIGWLRPFGVRGAAITAHTSPSIRMKLFGTKTRPCSWATVRKSALARAVLNSICTSLFSAAVDRAWYCSIHAASDAGIAVAVGVEEGVFVGVNVGVCVWVGVGVAVAVGVLVGMSSGVGVSSTIGALIMSAAAWAVWVAISAIWVAKTVVVC